MNREPMTRGEIFDIVRRVQSGEDRKDIAARYGITRSTISNYMRRYGLIRDDRAGRGPRRTVDDEWMNQAACVDPVTRLPKRDKATDEFFTEWHVDDQRRVCSGCPVWERCLLRGRRFRAGLKGWPPGWGPVYGGVPPQQWARLEKAS